MGYKLNGREVSHHDVARAAEGHIFTVKIRPDGADLVSVTREWQDQVFWACGFGLLIGLGLALGIVVIMRG